MKDFYPSRYDGQAQMLPRMEPCAWQDWSPAAPMTRSQYDHWCRDGFLVLNNLFSETETALFRRELARLEHNRDLMARPQAVTESGTGDLRSLFSPHQYSNLYKALSRDRRLLEIAHFLLDDDVYIHQARVNFKPGLTGKGFYWHSDFETWHTEDGMPRMRALSVSITLTDNTAANGPLMLIPGSHKTFVSCPGRTPAHHHEQSLQAQKLGTPPADHLTRLSEDGGITPIMGKAGSVVLFDCNTLHGSSENLSPRPRSNIFFVFNSVRNRLSNPFAAPSPRPDYLAARGRPRPLEALRPDYQALACDTRDTEALEAETRSF